MISGDGGPFRPKWVFTHPEIDYVVKVLDETLEINAEMGGSEVQAPEWVDEIPQLIERFNKARFDNRNEVPIELEEDDLAGCYHCLLAHLLEMELEVLFEMWEPKTEEYPTEWYEWMALICTILAKLSGPPEDDGGGPVGSAAAAAR